MPRYAIRYVIEDNNGIQKQKNEVTVWGDDPEQAKDELRARLMAAKQHIIDGERHNIRMAVLRKVF